MPGWYNEGDGPLTVAVAVGYVTGDSTHVGVAHQFAEEDPGLHLLHLAFHHDLRHERLGDAQFAQYLLLVPHVHQTRLEFLATRCRQVARRLPRIPYGFRMQLDATFDRAGEYRVADDRGLTCSTFVIALFRAAEIKLIDEQTWRQREQDIKRHKELLNFLRRRADPDWIHRVEADVETMRVRPEETAGCCLATQLPVSFLEAMQLGQRVLERLAAQRPA